MNADAEARQKQLFEHIGFKPKKQKEMKKNINTSHKSVEFINPPNKTIKVKIIKDWDLLANLPTKSHRSDAGWDLYTVEGPFELMPGDRHIFYTGISFEIPEGYVGLIWPRSGMAVKKGIDVLAGEVDAGYRGEVKVCLLNTGDEPCTIRKGDRIAQILFQEVPNFDLEIVSEFSTSDRGEGGFGSTGF
jgi:dUTP pyrophosphatase